VANYGQLRRDARYIIGVLRAGLDYSRIGAAQLAWMQLIEDYCEQGRAEQSFEICEDLRRLAEDPEVQETAQADPAYTSGVAQMCRGVKLLSHDSQSGATLEQALADAVEAFRASHSCFHQAGAQHGEAVALLAKGIVHQRQYEHHFAFPIERHWAQTLKALERSLNLFRLLQDGRQFEVRVRLAEVRGLYEEWIEAGQPNPKQKASSQTTSPNRQGKVIRLLGRIAAGQPILAEENIEDDIVVDDEIGKQADFALRVSGDSMIEAAILHDDIVFVHQTPNPPPNGQIAVVIVKQMDPQATIKRFYKEQDHIRLEPANESYPFIIVKSSRVSNDRIRGVYGKRNPKRLLEIYSDVELQVIGWATGLIREKL
jgi:SOS regulatory protein LexA